MCPIVSPILKDTSLNIYRIHTVSKVSSGSKTNRVDYQSVSFLNQVSLMYYNMYSDQSVLPALELQWAPGADATNKKHSFHF